MRPPCRQTPLRRGYSQPVARRDAPASERALVDLERAAVRDLGVVERARVGVAGLHVEDLQDAPVPRVEGNRERDEGVLHPEGAALILREDEGHARVGRKGGPAHEPVRALRRRVRDLDRDRLLVIAVYEDGPSGGLRTVPRLSGGLRTVPATAAGEEGEGHGEERPRRGSRPR